MATPSTSVDVSVPLVVSAALVSVRSNVFVPLITAASFTPVMFTVILLVVPSAALTVNVSVALTPSANWFCAFEAV